MTSDRAGDPGSAERATVLPGIGVRDDVRRVSASRTPSWRPSPLIRRLVTLWLLSIGLGLLAQNAVLILLALPGLIAAAVWLRGPRPGTLDMVAELDTPRAFEDQRITLTVSAKAAASAGSVRLLLRPELEVEVAADQTAVSPSPEARGRWPLIPRRWGYWPAATVLAQIRSGTRAWVAEESLEAPGLTIYPPAGSAPDAPPPPQLRRRLGPHVSRAPGTGIEFAGIREYLPGDSIRRVNWAQSSRRDAWLVNEFAQEQMADVVVLIDSMRDLGPEGRTSIDRSVRGATEVVQAYLQLTDRVGVVAFGSALRWMTPTTGTRHFYRVVETLLQARQARTYVDPSLDRLPRAVLPAGALVVCFSPLLDPLVIEAIRDLRERAHPVVVVDVLPTPDHPSAEDALAVRLWRLERHALTASLRRIGIGLVPYEETTHGSLSWLAAVAAGRAGRPRGGVR